MAKIYARKVIDEQGNEIIELDLNKPWPVRESEFDEGIGRLGNMHPRSPRKSNKEFITLLN